MGVLLATAALILAVARGGEQKQPPPLGPASRFNLSEFFDPPHQSQMKYRLSGAEARQEGSSGLRITQMKLETFREDGGREMVVESPDCIYDTAERIASSPGRLQVESGDGRFFVEGEGFLWRAGDSVLTISNQVRSLLKRATTNAPGTETKPPLVITSQRFEFDMARYQGVYRDQVHGDDPEMEFTCGLLTASASTNVQSFDRLVAENAVKIVGKRDGLTANADRVTYVRAEETMELAGHITWKQARQEGRADRAKIYRRDGSIEAQGKVAMKLPRESFGVGGFFLTSTKTNPPASAVTNVEPSATDVSPLIDLFTDQFQSRSNLTVAEGAVWVVDAASQLTCDKLTVQSATAGSPEDTAIAEGHVAVSQGEQGQQLRSGRAVYTKSNELIVFTDSPEWNLEQSEGSADRVTIHKPTGEIHAETNVLAKVTLGPQQGSFMTFFPEAVKSNSAPQVIEVFAADLKAKDRLVTFQGDVHAHQAPITGSEPRMRTDVLDMRFGTNSHRVEAIQARDNVICEQGFPGTTEGTNVHRKLITRTLTAHADPSTGAFSKLSAEGAVQIEQPGNLARSERAAYTAATDLLELTGNPTLETPQVTIIDARALTWDKANNGFSATAPYKIKLWVDAVKKVSARSKP